MKQERENSKLCYIDGENIIEYVTNQIDDIVVELQKVRIQKGISQYKLSQMTGLAHTTIMRIENLSKQPSLEALMRMALALNVTFDIGQADREKLSKSKNKSELSNVENVDADLMLCPSSDHQYHDAEIDHGLALSSGNLGTPLSQSFPEFVQEIHFYSIGQVDHARYIDEIEAFFRHYMMSIMKHDVGKKLADKISEFSKNLVLVLREYYIGQHASAYDLFSEAMSKVNLSSLYYQLLPNLKLYRAREQKGREPLGQDAFFHIPFEERIKVSSQRYSFPGLPCLYMGSSAEVCLKELGHRNNPVAVAEIFFVSNDKYHILDLTRIFDKSAELMNIEDQNTFLELLPLIFLCSTRISEDSREKVATVEPQEIENRESKICFRPDYIIPQLLLEYILDKTVWREEPVIGIQYYSVKEDFYSQWLHGDIHGLEKKKNIVIPVRTSANMGHCKELEAIFRVGQITQYD